jgi:hypothetical protein
VSFPLGIGYVKMLQLYFTGIAKNAQGKYKKVFGYVAGRAIIIT